MAQCTNKGETVPTGNGTNTVAFNFTIDNADDLWNFYNMYNHEVYCFTVTVAGMYTFTKPTIPSNPSNEFLCMIYGYDEDVTFYAAPNLLGSNQTTGGSFQVNLLRILLIMFY